MAFIDRAMMWHYWNKQRQGGTSAEAAAAFEKYEDLGDGLTDAEKTAMSIYIDAEVANGNHTKKDYELIMGLSGANSLVDYIGGKVATAVNAPTHSVNGYAFNGSMQYIESNYIATTDAVNYGLNDAQAEAFIFADNSIASNPVTYNLFSSTAASCSIIWRGDTLERRFTNNRNTQSAVAGNSPFESGVLYSTLRYDATNARYFLNGVESSVAIINANGIPSTEFVIGSASFTGTISTFMVGASLSSQSEHYTNLSTLLTALQS